MKQVWVILFCCLNTCVCMAQADTLTDPFFYLNKANELIINEPQNAFDLSEKALAVALREQNNRAEAYCYNTFGSIHYSLGKYDLAVESFARALTDFKALGEQKGVYLTEKYLGQTHEANGNNLKAIEFYEAFLSSATQLGIEDDVNEAKDALGRLYFNEGRYDLALGIFEVQKQKAEVKKDEQKLAALSNWIGKIYDIQNDTSAALESYREGLENGINSANQDAVWGYYENVNEFYGNRGNRKDQIKTNNQAISYYSSEKKKRNRKKNKNAFEQKQIKELNSNLYNSNLNQAQGYLQDNKPLDAIPYINNSIDLAEDMGVLENEVQSYEVLVEAYEKVGDYDKALIAYKSLVKSRDSLSQEREQEKLLALKLEADLYDRDKRITLLQREVKLSQAEFDLQIKEKEDEAEASKLITYSLLGGFGILLISFFVFIRGSREKKKANQLLLLKSLRTQMNPHFIFNSLNSVNSFISQSDERAANKYLSEFSKLMRMVLENSKHDFVSLASELKTLELYLGLEHLRFKDKFEYNFEVDVESTDSIEVPPMLVQPYIENAVWHGLRYAENKGVLSVSCKESEHDLRWIIEDNGVGRERSKALKTKHQREGKSTGMKNIEERIRIIKELYGQDMFLNVSDLNPDGTGTKVELVIPKRKAA